MLDRQIFDNIIKPLRRFLDHDGYHDVCINGPGELFTLGNDGWEQHQVGEITPAWCHSFTTIVANNSLMRTDKDYPILSTALLSGERIQAVVPSVVQHPSITIRRPHGSVVALDDYAQKGLLNKHRITSVSHEDAVRKAVALYQDNDDVEACLRYCIEAKLNIIFSGSTGSGKTTITNTLGNLIPQSERVITIEDAAELSFSHSNHVAMFYPRNTKNPAVTPDDLLASAMRMAPDRIVFGELRGAEAFFYIDQINTGHAGSITTIHANSARKALKRLVKLVKRSAEGRGFTNEEIREDVSEEVHAIFHWAGHGIDHAYFPAYEESDTYHDADRERGPFPLRAG